jgi:tetratricopeptide (TPR) repeat protein
MELISTVWNDPAALRRVGVVLQWLAISLIFLGGVVQVGKLLLDVREKNLTASLNAAKEQQRQQKQSELEVSLKISQEELSHVQCTASDLAKKLREAEAAAPKLDPSGRIAASPFVSFASEFSEGIAKARKLFAEGQLDDAYVVAEELKKKKDNFGLAYFIMGTVQAQKGNLEPAEQLLKTAIGHGLPKDDEAWARHNLGIVYLRAGNVGDALANLEQASALAPGNVEFENILKQVRGLRQ